MAESVVGEFKNDVASLELLPSSGGVFEVTVNGNLIFSKKSIKRFPEEDEVESELRNVTA